MEKGKISTTVSGTPPKQTPYIIDATSTQAFLSDFEQFKEFNIEFLSAEMRAKGWTISVIDNSLDPNNKKIICLFLGSYSDD